MSPRPTISPVPPKPNKQRLFIGVVLAIVLLGGIASFLVNGGKSKKSGPRKSEIVQITLPPPPPPPPPPPRVEPPKEEPPKEDEMVEQEPVPDDEPPPDNTPLEAPSDDLSTGIAGNGPDMGLSGGNGNGGKIGGTGRKGGGSKFGWYAAKVQTSIADALRRHPSTRNAKMVLQVRVWPDSNGRITRAQLVGTSGNPAVDQAIKNQILTGLQLPQAPPADMPVPIVLRISASKALL
jgi:outer membrane biosynthesis protein TonB